jgi:hypothetical protein
VPGELRAKSMPVRPQRIAACFEIAGHRPDPHIEVPARLRDVPAIAGQAALEEPQPAGSVVPVIGELFLEDRDLPSVLAGPQRAKERPMPTSRLDR